MTVQDLITRLSKLDPTLNVMAQDSAGLLDLSSCSEGEITEGDADNCGDCDGRVGEAVAVIYFG